MTKLAGILLGTLLALGVLVFDGTTRAESAGKKDQYTSIIARPITSMATPVLGSDGKYHVAYELILQNASPALRATLTRVDVLSGDNQDEVLVSLSGQMLREHLFGLSARLAETLNIPVDGGRLLAVNLKFGSVEEIPETVFHRISAQAADNPGTRKPVAIQVDIGTVVISAPQQLVVGPPVKGKGWVAINGCCGLGFPHRMSVLPIDGQLVLAQRFAIDWMQLNDNGKLVEGPIEDVKSWTGYGAELLAIADGTVIHVSNTLDDQVPGKLPDPRTLTLETVDGNAVILDFGNGAYAMYGHIKKGSVKVKVGDKVIQGDVLGLLGNSGNTSAPHLHLQIMTGASPLAFNGIPYLINSFELAGKVDRQEFFDSKDLTGDFGSGRFKAPELLRNVYPLQLDIVDFPK